LSSEGERIYRDKGYFGAPAKGKSVIMWRATRGHPLSTWDSLRNLQISRIRAPGERPFAVIGIVFRAAHGLCSSIILSLNVSKIPNRGLYVWAREKMLPAEKKAAK
jgi:transposase, IS5 family